jgi:hypothetical protein
VKVSQDLETFLQFMALSDIIQVFTSIVMIAFLKYESVFFIGIWEIIWLFFWLLQSIPMAFGISAVFQNRKEFEICRDTINSNLRIAFRANTCDIMTMASLTFTIIGVLWVVVKVIKG